MNTGECTRMLREGKLSIHMIAKLCNTSGARVKMLAESLGIQPRERRGRVHIVCEGKPECCFECPYDECLDYSVANSTETSFVNQALGRYNRKGSNDHEK